MALIDGDSLYGYGDDLRHMFFQFPVAPEEYWLCVQYAIFEIDGVLWLCAVHNTTMNMGSRPASKIACRFAEEWLEAWRLQLDSYVLSWLETKSAAFRQVYAERLSAFGVGQARPYSAKVYTDNYDMLFIGVEMLIKGIAIWQSMCDRANIWRAPEAIIIGTCVLWIGGRCVLNGGFGCLVPSKRQRAIEACSAALDGLLTRDAYEASNSFLGYAQDVLHSSSARSRASPDLSSGQASAQTSSS